MISNKLSSLLFVIYLICFFAIINESYSKKNLKNKIQQAETAITEPATSTTSEPAITELTAAETTQPEANIEAAVEEVVEPTKSEITVNESLTATSNKLKKELESAVEEAVEEEEVVEEKTDKEVKPKLLHISNVFNKFVIGNTLSTRDNVEFLRSLDPELEGLEMVYPFEHVDAVNQDYYLRSDETCFPEDMDALKEATNKEVYDKIVNCGAGNQEQKIWYYALWDRTSTVYENVSMVRGESEVLQDYIMFDVSYFKRFFIIIYFHFF
jgi:hypothetical protein